MNKQGPGKIEWCDWTWNPLTGCLHNCPYCYAKRDYARFGWSFEPAFHPERLSEPLKKKPAKIFVCSTSDICGEWVAPDHLDAVLQACHRARQHQYLFLTKNPKGYKQFGYKPDNWWFGTTITCQDDVDRIGYLPLDLHRFISIEPLLDAVDLEKRKYHYAIPFVDWIIIGRQTGPGAINPSDKWVQDIIDHAKAAGVPVFVKRPLYSRFPIQEWPEGLEAKQP